MADLTVQEQLQPSLLDRLTDDARDQREESRDRRVISMTRLRECVVRDLGFLLNAGGIETVGEPMPPHTATSVLNYGLPPLAGVVMTEDDLADIERSIHRTITAFEPRIIGETLTVRMPQEINRKAPTQVVFHIEGEIWATPVPIKIYLKTAIDLEINRIEVTPMGGRG